ncbi:pyridoxamine 5'-phosphate oxidase [Orrella daihaiensis]|uniref:Pyridoxine/pyridoxamine 5'-phosphate oxidase n=1 Tax=Orrella daihaiensis TaxID=2782176 RepID=A0ABY4ALF4_9BURK|nr:pyridoxamine 5'-phosphate oxidase [Orrella daihaiensis]UOD51136.1 pyridoxamine 5'-phosphate oxidase [Orrella daihaiensis]
MSVADIRQSYEKGELLESQAKSSPFDQFEIWMNEAIALPAAEPTAMTLATADSTGKPTARIVLLKGYDTRGFVFYTNYQSRKGCELADEPRATLLFFWQPLERQVRIEGVVEKVSPEESDEYYQSRPLGSRIGAWASAQSQPVSIEQLKAKVEEVSQKYGDSPPRPDHWGGYRVRPTYFEFWQGRPSRLHDRLAYQQSPDGEWIIERLSP